MTKKEMYKVVEHLKNRINDCYEIANKNDDAALKEMAYAWRMRAEGIRDALEIIGLE